MDKNFENASPVSPTESQTEFHEQGPGFATTQNAILVSLSSGENATLETLDKIHVGIQRATLKKSVRGLIEAGFVKRVTRGTYCLTQAGKDKLASGKAIKTGKKGKRSEVRASKPGGLKQRIWNAMRSHNSGGVKRSFSLPDLLTVALNEGEETSTTYPNMSQYLAQLRRAGFLVAQKRRQPGTRPGSNGFMTYKLERDTGNQAPVVRVHHKQVFDRNTGEAYPW